MDDKDRIRDAIDIVDFINDYTPLKKAGRNYKANCPFHGESTPSFFVSSERQAWHCFGCGLGGDIFSFIMEYEKIDFQESLRILAKRAGITLSSAASSGYSKKETYYQINQFASNFYHYLLTEHKTGEKAREYLKNRGVNDKLIKNFKIGFAPLQRNSLLNYLVKKKNFNPQDLELIGLINRRNGGLSDFFTNRIMFPLIDHRENIIGFSGRTLSDIKTVPKYINTKETPIYHKGEHFFGINTAKDSMRKEEKVILVEGEFDLISIYAQGIENVVAVKGTALTEKQVELLSRYVKKVVMLFDQDGAGQDALVKSIPVLEKNNLIISVIKLDEKDPDEEIKKSPYEFKKKLSRDINVYDYLIDKALMDKDINNVEEKIEASNYLLNVLVNIKNQVMLEHYLKKLSLSLDVSMSSLKNELSKISSSGIKTQLVKKNSGKVKKDGLELTEQYLLSLLVQSKSIAEISSEIFPKIDKLLSNRNAYERVLSKLSEYILDNKAYDQAKFEGTLPVELVETLTNALLYPINVSQDKHDAEFKKTAQKTYELLIKYKLNEIAIQIKSSEISGQENEELHIEYQNLIRLSKEK